jgi:hypothetical protein
MPHLPSLGEVVELPKGKFPRVLRQVGTFLKRAALVFRFQRTLRKRVSIINMAN